MPTLVLHGDSDVALGEELLDGIEAAVPDVSGAAGALAVSCWWHCAHVFFALLVIQQ
jgi:hypothetical protein